MDLNLLVPIIVVAALVVFVVMSAVRIVPQARRYNVERFGRYRTTLEPGLNFIIPLADRINTKLDVREQVFSSQPKPVITEDNLVVNIDTVLYYQITDPRAAAYEIADYLQAIDQLTVTTLRNVIGSMDLEQTLTSREEINTRLRIVLDEATGKWGIRVNRVEIKAIDHRSPSRRPWRSRCGPSATSAQPFCTRKGNGSPRSLPPKGLASKRSWWPRATSRPRSCGPTVRPGPSTWFSRPSTATTLIPRYWPTSTWRRCLTWQEAVTPSGSSQVKSRRRSAPSRRLSATTPGWARRRLRRAGR